MLARWIRLALVIVVFARCTTVQAAPPCAETKTIFSCVTQKNKQIQVCDLGERLRYFFGKADNPELVLHVARADASTQQWSGIGRYINYRVDLPNGDTTYQVFWAADRLADPVNIEAGVMVLKQGKILATVNCRTSTPVQQRMEGIALKSNTD